MLVELQLALQELLTLLLNRRQLLNPEHLLRVDHAPLASLVDDVGLTLRQLLREGLLRYGLVAKLVHDLARCGGDTSLRIVHQDLIRLLVIPHLQLRLQII